jgi:hypothetical protein
MGSRYLHTPLADPFSIRVILVKPASDGSDPLCGSLQEVSLNSPPKYSALSYAWDSQKASCPIECDGKILEITPNCRAALCRLRSADDELCFWIDSICIDQESPSERNQQVSLMDEIYKRAERVIVWLGEGDPAAELALQRVSDLGRFSTAGVKSEDEKAQWDSLLQLLFGVGIRDPSQDPLSALWDLSWFHRMWTVQEVTLPQFERVEVRYATTSTEWIFILLAVKLLSLAKYKWGKWDEATYLQRKITALLVEKREPGWRDLIDDESIDTAPYTGILQLLIAMRAKKASDPKDKVFALLGIAKELNLILPSLDYGKSLDRVYIDTAALCIKSSSSLDILYEAPSPNRCAGLPSWVPDWSDENWNPSEARKYIAKNFPTNANQCAQFGFSNDSGQLIVSGRLVDYVEESGAVLGAGRDFSDDFMSFADGRTKFQELVQNFSPSLEVLKRWVHLIARLSRYPTGESAEVAFRSTIIDGSFVDTRQTLDDASYEKWLDFMRADLTASPVSGVQKFLALCTTTSPSSASSTSASEFHFAVLRRAKGKCFFCTAHGYFGLAAGVVQPGDAIALIQGLKVPWVLRKADEHYKLVTYCYVHGLMSGCEKENIAMKELLTLA